MKRLFFIYRPLFYIRSFVRFFTIVATGKAFHFYFFRCEKSDNIFENMRCDKILIHHCDDGKDNFCEKAKEYLRSKGITTPVVPVNKGANQFVL